MRTATPSPTGARTEPVLAGRLNPRAAALRPSDIRLITQRIISGGLDPIRMDIGEPDQPTPEHIQDAAAIASAELSRYAPAPGTAAFREAAAAYLGREHDVAVDAADIVVTAGATGGLMMAFALLAGPGDEVLVPTPGFPSYRTQIALTGADAVGYPLRAQQGYLPQTAELEALITPRTKAIVINTPGNPTGAVFPVQTLDALAELAERHDLAIISDEVYLDLVLEGSGASMISRNRDRVFGIFSLSKSFSMTGWRLGYCVVPPGLAAVFSAVGAQFNASVNSVAQAAGVAALNGPLEHLEQRRQDYRMRRDAVSEWLTAQQVAHTTPKGSFYQLLPLPEGTDPMAAALALLDDGVAAVPSTAFGPGSAPALRICLTAAPERLISGLELIRDRFWR